MKRSPGQAEIGYPWALLTKSRMGTRPSKSASPCRNASTIYVRSPADAASRNPMQEINRHDGGRGVYFEDPNGHLMEIITRPYGSGGWNP